MTTKRSKPTYLSTETHAKIQKLIDLAFDLAGHLERGHAEELGHLLLAIRCSLPDNPRAHGVGADVSELLESKDIRNLGIHSVNRARRGQGKPALSNIRRREPEQKPPAADQPTKSDVDRMEDLLRAYLVGRYAATVEAPEEPASEPIDDAPPCRAFTELDSALLAADLDAWLADGGNSDEE